MTSRSRARLARVTSPRESFTKCPTAGKSRLPSVARIASHDNQLRQRNPRRIHEYRNGAWLMELRPGGRPILVGDEEKHHDVITTIRRRGHLLVSGVLSLPLGPAETSRAYITSVALGVVPPDVLGTWITIGLPQASNTVGSPDVVTRLHP